MNRLKMMNLKVNEDNGKSLGIVNGCHRKIWRFSSNEFWKNIGCLVSDPNFSLGGLRMWEKQEAIDISVNNRKGRSISIKVDLYEVCISYIIYCLLLYFITILTPFFSTDLWYLSH